MTSWLLWTRGLRGPEISVLHTGGDKAPGLSEFEKNRVISGPDRLTDEEAGLTLERLRELRPAPAVPEDA